jgi:hypothetical protein
MKTIENPNCGEVEECSLYEHCEGCPANEDEGESDAPRPIVKAFAKEMEKQLRDNEHKGGWEKCSSRFLMNELSHNYGKLRGALDWGDRKEVIRRSANVANFAMMLSENEGKLES